MTVTTKIYYWHDGVLEPTNNIDNAGCSHIIVTFINGVPVGSVFVLGE